MTEIFTDRMIASVLERVASAEGVDYELARALAEEFPEASGLALVFAITSAASGLEDMSGDAKVPALYRLAAMIAADLFAYEARNAPLPDGETLRALWLSELPGQD
ncbi:MULTISPECIES: hypothetical protein [unclassified Dinoroseobacter]|uniref:hypothetical protein n=1 Tax=unclassified Dinoroseobacter TaxID=2620028 RepID=UPI003C7E3CEF